MISYAQNLYTPWLRGLVLCLLAFSFGCGNKESTKELEVRVSRLLPSERIEFIHSLAADVALATGEQVRVRRKGLLGSGAHWLMIDTEVPASVERADGFSEPIENLILTWLQETEGMVWAAPGEVTRLAAKGERKPFLEWLEEWEAESLRGYPSRRFSPKGIDSIDRRWRSLNRQNEQFSYGHQHFRHIRPEHFDEHPYLFAKDAEGKAMRPPYSEASGFNDHPDLSEPRVVDRIAEAAIEYFEKNPNRQAYSIALSDSFEFGHFSEDYPFFQEGRYFRRYPDYSNHVFHFSNQVAERVAELHPDKYLGALAYLSWENVPDFPVHSNIVPYLTADRTQWYDEDFREEDLKLVEQWVNAGPDYVGTWDYFFGYGFLIPRSLIEYTVDSIRELYDRGVRGYYNQVAPTWAYDAHRVWLTKQLLWNVEADADSLLDQFFEAYYGAAAEPMRSFFDHSEQIWMNQPGRAVWLRYYLDAHQAFLYSENDLKTMRAYLETAKTAVAENGTPDHQRRVKWADEVFELTEVFVEFVWLRDWVSKFGYRRSDIGGQWAVGSGLWAVDDNRWAGESGLSDGSEEATALRDAGEPRSPEDSLPSLIERLDMLENQLRQLRERLIENPLHRHLADTDWVFHSDPRPRVRAELEDKSPSNITRLGWDLWETHWRTSLLDSQDAHLDLSPRPPNTAHRQQSTAHSSPKSVRAANVRRGQLFMALRAEPGVTYQARVPFVGKNGPSANVFVRLDWYDADYQQIGSTAVDRLPPGEYDEPFVLGPVAKAPENTAYIRVFIRFYEQEIGDELWVGEVELWGY